MNSDQYMEALQRIEQGNPAEVLLRLLRTGHSRANEIYLRSALKRLQAHSESPLDGGKGGGSPLPFRGEPVPTRREAGGGVDDTLRALWRERTRLFGEMNKQSNLFHSCSTDADRAANSDRVLAWWNDILAVKAKIAHYEQHGELPPVEQEGEELPDNPVALSKKLASLRARISQVKKKLLDLASLDPSTGGKQSKIDAAENDLKRLRFQEGKAVEKLKTYEQAA